MVAFLDMRAVIFAAGLGTRLWPLTETVPKPLIVIGSKTVLQRTLDALPDTVDGVVIVVGYKSELIRASFNTPSGLDISIRFVEQPELRGTLDALHTARPALHSGPFLALNGDDLYAKKDLEKLAGPAPRSLGEGGFAALAKRVPSPNAYSHLETADGRLVRIIPKTKTAGLSSTMTYTGACLLNERFFNLAPAALANGELSLPHTLEKHLNTNPVRVIEAGFWMPVGTPAELETARHVIRE